MSSDGFWPALTSTASQLQCNASDLWTCIWFESKAIPSIRNPFSGAVGLIQFMPATLKPWGLTTDQVAAMSDVDQLSLVLKYMSPFVGKLNSLRDLYLAIWWPAAVGKPDNYAIANRGSIVYAQNPGMDVDNDSVITAGDVGKRIEAVRNSAMANVPVGAYPSHFCTLVAGESPRDRLIKLVKSLDGVSLVNKKDVLVGLIGRGVENPGQAEQSANLHTNCATSAIGVIASVCGSVDAARDCHKLLATPTQVGMAFSWWMQIGYDTGAYTKYTGVNGPQPKAGDYLHYAVPGTNDDHTEAMLSDMDANGQADHAGGGRALNAITVGHGNVLTSMTRPLIGFWDLSKLNIPTLDVNIETSDKASGT